MKNITVTVDDELYRRARVRAAEEGTSVSAVVKTVLRDYAQDKTAVEARAGALAALFERVDARLRGKVVAPAQPGWRDRMYDERFEETALGRRLAGREH